MSKDSFITTDKMITAFLLLCSEVEFEGKEEQEGIMTFSFSPQAKAEELAQLFEARRVEQQIQPKDYAEQLKTITKWIWEARNKRDGGIDYERKKFFK